MEIVIKKYFSELLYYWISSAFIMVRGSAGTFKAKYGPLGIK